MTSERGEKIICVVVYLLVYNKQQHTSLKFVRTTKEEVEGK